VPLPAKPVTLTVEEIDDLNRKLATMRHDINNNLSLIVAAIELLRFKPQMAEQMRTTLSEQPGKINESLKKFSIDFEGAFGITRP
jgi:Cu/Ag efflux protein CusF